MCGLSRGGGVPWSTSMMTTSMMTTSGGGTLVHFHDHFWGGGGVPWSTSMTTSMTTSGGRRGYPGPLPWPLLGGRGVPCDLPIILEILPLCCPDTNWWVWLATAHYIHCCPNAFWEGHMGPPQSWTDWQTNMSENITFPHTMYAGGKNREWWMGVRRNVNKYDVTMSHADYW